MSRCNIIWITRMVRDIPIHINDKVNNCGLDLAFENLWVVSHWFYISLNYCRLSIKSVTSCAYTRVGHPRPRKEYDRQHTARKPSCGPWQCHDKLITFQCSSSGRLLWSTHLIQGRKALAQKSLSHWQRWRQYRYFTKVGWRWPSKNAT